VLVGNPSDAMAVDRHRSPAAPDDYDDDDEAEEGQGLLRNLRRAGAPPVAGVSPGFVDPNSVRCSTPRPPVWANADLFCAADPLGAQPESWCPPERPCQRQRAPQPTAPVSQRPPPLSVQLSVACKSELRCRRT